MNPRKLGKALAWLTVVVLVGALMAFTLWLSTFPPEAIEWGK